MWLIEKLSIEALLKKPQNFKEIFKKCNIDI